MKKGSRIPSLTAKGVIREGLAKCCPSHFAQSAIMALLSYICHRIHFGTVIA
jgi:hypothetical protein